MLIKCVSWKFKVKGTIQRMDKVGIMRECQIGNKNMKLRYSGDSQE